MSSFEVVAAKVADVAKLTAGFVAQAAAGLVNKAEALSVDEMSRRLDGALRALRGEDVSTSGAATTSLPASKTAPTITIEHMKAELRRADCLYDDTKRWKQLGATKVPKIPDTVIQEAYEKGGRVILRCSSISEKAEALKEANRSVYFWGSAEQSDYQKSVSKPEWIVVPSHIDRSTLGSPKSKIVTSEMPAPTPEDLFSVIAYARLDGGRQPKGCEGLSAFTTESGTVITSCDDGVFFDRNISFDDFGHDSVGAARFGPPRN
jgi:hypothetical protein